MGKSKRHYIELLKNIALVVLFFTTMLLLYFFWSSPISDGFKISDIIGMGPVEVPAFESVTKPGVVVVHLGDGSYTVLEDDSSGAWEKYIEAMKELVRDDVLSVDEITAEQFEKIMEFRSILFNYYYDLPYDVLSKIYNTPEIPGLDQIGSFSLVAFSSGSPESLFAYSSTKNKYYRIVSASVHHDIDDMLSEIESKKNPDYYRRIGDLVGTATNKTVVPIYKESTASPISYVPEFSDLDSAEVHEFAQSFFGESLDFVRQIHGSKGTRIYMYGYGEKILTIGAGGKVEFKNKETPLGSQQNYFEALDTALQFVASHGGWQVNGSEVYPYVLAVKQIEKNKQKGFRIVFATRILSEPLYCENSYSIMTEVISGQVTHYIRNMIQIDDEELNNQDMAVPAEAYSAINMIAQNYSYIAGVLTENGYDFSVYKEEELFDAVSDAISLVKVGYVKPENDESGDYRLIPAWVVNAEDILIFFDLYDAKPLGYTSLFKF
ncbi:hypothetical protein MASR2M70_22000 [Bacillota bacterium]